LNNEKNKEDDIRILSDSLEECFKKHYKTNYEEIQKTRFSHDKPEILLKVTMDQFKWDLLLMIMFGILSSIADVGQRHMMFKSIGYYREVKEAGNGFSFQNILMLILYNVTFKF